MKAQMPLGIGPLQLQQAWVGECSNMFHRDFKDHLGMLEINGDHISPIVGQFSDMFCTLDSFTSFTLTGSDTTLTVIAPRSFTYLRRLAGLDCEALLTELLQTNVGGLKVAAKSGSSLLCSSDNRTFVLKTISKSEVRQVRAMLAEYRALELQHCWLLTPSQHPP